MYRVVCDIYGLENVIFDAWRGVPMRLMDTAEAQASRVALEGAVNVDIQHFNDKDWVLVSHHVERELA